LKYLGRFVRFLRIAEAAKEIVVYKGIRSTAAYPCQIGLSLSTRQQNANLGHVVAAGRIPICRAILSFLSEGIGAGHDAIEFLEC